MRNSSIKRQHVEKPRPLTSSQSDSMQLLFVRTCSLRSLALSTSFSRLHPVVGPPSCFSKIISCGRRRSVVDAARDVTYDDHELLALGDSRLHTNLIRVFKFLTRSNPSTTSPSQATQDGKHTLPEEELAVCLYPLIICINE